MAYLKKLVSKKKRRYYEDGFDLDLSYIKANIVAMGFPSERIEGVYRNHIDEILRFLETKHKDHYKVYNLCSERQYDPSRFNNRVANYPFDDHNAPPFQLMKPYCEDMVDFLSADDRNVAFVHCKAGKGRTGVMICAYLLHKNFFKSCKEALEYYGDARTSNKKGVTIPSQRRYVYYYAHYLRHKLEYMPTTLLITGFVMETIPSVNNGTCLPFFYVWQSKVKIYSSKSQENPKKGDKSISFFLPQLLPVCGDIKVQFYNKERTFKNKDLMFQFWFNTYFVSGLTPKASEGEASMEISKDMNNEGNNGATFYFELQKEDLDKANKDKRNKIFAPNFKLKVLFTVPDLKEHYEDDCKESYGTTNIGTMSNGTMSNGTVHTTHTTAAPGTPTGTFTTRRKLRSPETLNNKTGLTGKTGTESGLTGKTGTESRLTGKTGNESGLTGKTGTESGLTGKTGTESGLTGKTGTDLTGKTATAGKTGISHSSSTVSIDGDLSDSDDQPEWGDKINST